MATEEIVPKEVLDAISATCDMITVADKYAMINNNKEFKLVSDVCSVTGDSIKTYDIVLKYSEDANGVKHILAESFGNLVSDITFEQSFEKAIKQSAVAGTIVAMTDSPAPGPADIAGAVVFLGGATKGYVVSKAKAWAAGEFTKESILKLWPDQDEIKAYEDNKSIYEKKDGNITLPNDKEVQESIIPTLEKAGVEKVSIDNQTYTIQNGDTLSQIAQDNNTTVDKLIEDNPWLTEDNRISSDGSYALIKSGEKLNLTLGNTTTTFNVDENGITPEYQTDLNTNSIVPLQAGQTISHIAANTPYSAVDLLDYNGLTLEDARNLPAGYEVKVPQEVIIIDGIKIFKGADETGVIIQPDKMRIQYDENSDLLIYNNYEKVTFTDSDTGIYQEWQKDTNGNMYKALEVNDKFGISYDQNNNVIGIDIYGDNVSLDEIVNLTSYTKEELQAFNFLDGDTVDSNTNFQLPVSKEPDIEGGYGDITHFITNEGESIFIVPNEDGTTTTYGTFTDGFDNQASYIKGPEGSVTINLTNSDGSNRVIISNSDGYYFDSYGFDNKVDFSYSTNGQGDTIVSSLQIKEPISYEELVISGIDFNARNFALLNGLEIDSVFDLEILQPGDYKLPNDKSSFYIPETDTTVVAGPDGEFIVQVGNETYSTKDNGLIHSIDESTGAEVFSISTTNGAQEVAAKNETSFAKSIDALFGDSSLGAAVGGSDGGRTRVLKQILPASTCLEGLKNFTSQQLNPQGNCEAKI